MIAGLIFTAIGMISALFLRFQAFALLTVTSAAGFALLTVLADGGASQVLFAAITALVGLQVGYAVIVVAKVAVRRARCANVAQINSKQDTQPLKSSARRRN